MEWCLVIAGKAVVATRDNGYYADRWGAIPN